MAEPVNVLIVILNCARADHLSCYGYARETTPFLDQMARQGVRFSNVVSTAHWTLPAHASLLTGLYPVTHGATDENPFLSTRHAVLPECFKAAGYRTAAFCTNPWMSPETGFGRGFDAFYTQRHHNRLAARALSYSRRASDRLLRRKDTGARRTNQALRKWLAAGVQPFFAVVHYNEMHLPLQPPPPYDRIFLGKDATAARVAAVNRDSYRTLVHPTEMSEEDFAIVTALYDGGLRYVDTRIREIADFLSERGAWDRTLCVVVGDHGEHLGEHGMIGHRARLSDTLLRVPLLVRYPSQVPQGFTVDELAQTTDIAPTLLHLAGLDDSAGRMQGRALVVDGSATPGPSFTISEAFRPSLAVLQQRFPDFDTRPLAVRKKALRTRREKFVWHSDEANELYDLFADPAETRNLIESNAVRADALRRQLFDWLASVEQFESEEPAANAGVAVRNLHSSGEND